MSTPIIFPSLTRQPTMDTSLKVNDDTIRDQMDSGYVATRPRFTRSRRTWNVNIRNLTKEDVRALDTFSEATVQRGALSFYYPNLLGNSSFENPPVKSGDVFAEWYLGQTAGMAIGPSANASDGLIAAQIASVSGYACAPGTFATGILASRKQPAVNAGEVYVFSGSIDVAIGGTLPASSTFTAGLTATVYFADATTQQFLITQSGATSGYVPLTGTITIPSASTGGAPPSYLVLSLYAQFANASGSAVTFGSPSLSATFDSVGLALQSSPQKYGRMVGSSSLPCLVRFAASMVPAFSDLGARSNMLSTGTKLYGTTFALEEV